MSNCPTFAADGPAGIAEALRTVDCLSAQATATGFSRLFGADGALGTALTLLLTLYVGLMAIGLLTGRTRLGLSLLTPRAFALGLALTFATSWVAYQGVVWNLAVGAPDQIAGVVAGTHGSATAAFADRLDRLFAAVADAAGSVQDAKGEGAARPAADFGAADILWIGALLLLLGTVGVLLVTRIALAALLAVGPVFVVLSLFRGTRGLFEGWLKGVVLFAVTPLFAVLLGGGALAMLQPIVAPLAGGEVDQRTAVTVLLAAVVYCALMAIAVRVGVVLTAGWRLPGDRDGAGAPAASAMAGTTFAAPPLAAAMPAPSAGPRAVPDARLREIVVAAAAPAAVVHEASAASGSDRVRAVAAPMMLPAANTPPIGADGRARGLGGHCRSPSRPEKLPC